MNAIDRRALVTRHNVRLTSADPLEPLAVGNGEFAFTADVTGLQTLRDFHAGGMRLGTHAHWGWHTAPNPDGFTLDDSTEDYDTPDGRVVPYFTTGPEWSRTLSPSRARRASAWLRENPHRIDLGCIGLIRGDGAPISVHDIEEIDQQLDLWRGVLTSRFRLYGAAVTVTTACHPRSDTLGLRVESSLLTTGQLRIGIAFPYAVGDWHDPSDWDSPDAHLTDTHLTGATSNGRRCDIRRTLDSDVHHLAIEWSDGARLERSGPHGLQLQSDTPAVEAAIAFAPTALAPDLPTVSEIVTATERHWPQFWSSGAAVDLSGSTDARAPELERRVVLAQYLTALHCAGSLPPAETGLVTNSWRGKFHLEMHWWHAAHFPLWGRSELLERSLSWYERILSEAREYARRQGYRGVRWPKQIGPEGRESPSDVGAFLIWQQPHLIYFAELLRREHGDAATLERLASLVFDTAEFMASYPTSDNGGYALGSPIVSAQEHAAGERRVARNPTFELAYWVWGLQVAQEWRQRRGLTREPLWDRVAQNLAPLPIRDGRYVELERPVTGADGHPTMVGALGLVPDTGLVDRDVMSATLRGVLDSWDHSETWGWDYPLLAMTACRLNQPEAAVDALMFQTQKNTYLANGHNFQELPKLALYLPGNGGLLFAVAMMAGGWDGAPDRPAPGFPETGWRVRVEGFKPAP